MNSDTIFDRFRESIKNKVIETDCRTGKSKIVDPTASTMARRFILCLFGRKFIVKLIRELVIDAREMGAFTEVRFHTCCKPIPPEFQYSFERGKPCYERCNGKHDDRCITFRAPIVDFPEGSSECTLLFEPYA